MAEEWRLKCRGKFVTITIEDNGSVFFENWDEKDRVAEKSAVEDGFEGSLCWTVYQAIQNDWLDDELGDWINDTSSKDVDTMIELFLKLGANPDVLERTANVKRAKLLLEYGANVDTRGYLDQTALHAAADDGNINMITLLLDHGAKIDVRDENGETPLFRAVSYRRGGVINLLLEHDADIDALDQDDYTPLNKAIDENYAEIVELLLENGADPNTRWSSERVTPLHFAASLGNPAIIKLLLKYGADIDAIDRTGQTPLYLSHVSPTASPDGTKVLEDWIKSKE